jgi:hypothetical protein
MVLTGGRAQGRPRDDSLMGRSWRAGRCQAPPGVGAVPIDQHDPPLGAEQVQRRDHLGRGDAKRDLQLAARHRAGGERVEDPPVALLRPRSWAAPAVNLR